jgi:uncharacterized protein
VLEDDYPMRIIIDTNILISALFFQESLPGQVLNQWYDGRCELLAHDDWLAEIKEVINRPAIRARLIKHETGYLINRIKADAIWLQKIGIVDRSPDPKDNYLLALAEKGRADFLVTGDKADLLILGAHGSTQIVTAHAFLGQLAAISPLPARPR